jgi:DNA-binding NarL/FixJ family response regulator
VNGEVIRVVIVDLEMVAEGLAAVLNTTTDISVVATAPSADAAVAAVADHRPSVVLLEYHLPDGDGAAATRRILSEDPSVKVVVLATTDDPVPLRRAIEAGCTGYLHKAASRADLTAAVRAANAGQIVISPARLRSLLPQDPHHVDSPFTSRELEILRLMGEGLTNKAIAERLVLSVHTVRSHVQAVLAKLGAHSKLEAVVAARRRGLITGL